jgi:hypothetical protein
MRIKRIALIFIFLPLRLLASGSVQPPDTLKTCVFRAAKILDTIDLYANNMAMHVGRLQTGRTVWYKGCARALTKDLTRISASSKALTKNLNSLVALFSVTANLPYFREQYGNFELQRHLLVEKIISLRRMDWQPIYSAQIDYTENGVINFITTTGNFKQYLQSLIPPVPDSLLIKIRSRLDTTDNRVDSCLRQTWTLINNRTGKLQDSIRLANHKDDILIGLLEPHTNGRYFASLVAYDQSLFGLSFAARIGKTNAGATLNYLGAEILLPIASAKARDPGGSLFYGLRYDKLLLTAGAVYLRTTNSAENIAWKGSLLYTPGKVGIGLSYSPLTNIGLAVAYKW